MVLTIDIGNTNIVFGGFDNDKLLFISRIHTNYAQTIDEYSILIKDIISLYNIKDKSFSGGIISSVVPKLTNVLKTATEQVLGCKTLTISPGIKTGINIKTDNAATVGADFVAAAAGAIDGYKLPCIIVDLGTATKISVVDINNSFLGTSIMPGVNISLDALSNRTAQLPHISIDGEPPVIGTNTVDSMRSGIIYGSAACIDGMVEKFLDIVGKDATVIATGGIAPAIIKHCKNKIISDPDLILKGLLSIYKKNIVKLI